MEITIETLQKQLKDREETKLKLEFTFHQVLGQIQLLNEQIELLNKSSENIETK